MADRRTTALRVLEASRHGNKLRMGHLQGNRFEVVLQTCRPRSRRRIGRAAWRSWAGWGCPTGTASSASGRRGTTSARALAIVRGELRERDWRKRQFLLSALQSAVFNRALELRQERGGLMRVRAGDVLQKRASGGLFVCEDPAVDQARVDAGELVPTGPLPGNREKEPPEGTAARALEDEALAAVGVAARRARRRWGATCPARAGRWWWRSSWAIPRWLGRRARRGPEPGRVRLRFTLPPGSYATVVIKALGVTGGGTEVSPSGGPVSVG